MTTKNILISGNTNLFICNFVIPAQAGIYIMKQYYVYILASKKNGTLYVGASDNLIKRVYEHKNELVEGFTKKYKVHTLVYYETTNDAYIMVTRERQLKKWKRQWKINLIEKNNPEWKDLYPEL